MTVAAACAALGLLVALHVKDAAGDDKPPPPKPAPEAKSPPPAPPAAEKNTLHKALGDEMGDIETPPPPFSEDIFPCTNCHEKGSEADPTRRELSQHDFKFEHDAEHRWCYDCHTQADRDKLHLSSGELIDFTESYKLCGQCHGDKYRDWRFGVHGRRTGFWNGRKKYLLCVNCHNPHSPHFKPIEPKPAPIRPENIR